MTLISKPVAPPRSGDDAPAASPRNHWRSLSGIMNMLASGDAQGAWRALSAIGQSDMLGADALEAARRMIGDALAAQGGQLLDLPADYRRPSPGNLLIPPLAQLQGSVKGPANFPGEMILPPLAGNANDFTFLTDATLWQGFAGPLPAARLRIVVHLRDEEDLTQLSRGLSGPSGAGLSRLPGLSLVVAAPETLHNADLRFPVRWISGYVTQLPREAQIDLLCDRAEALLFAPAAAVGERFLAERALRFLALSGRVCLALADVADLAPPGEVQPTLLAQKSLIEPWAKMPFAFRRINDLAFACSTAQFRAVGGFDPRFRAPDFAARELAWRLFNRGSYFLPLPMRQALPRRLILAEDEADKVLLKELCPHPWERKASGRYEVPRVSIYIPAYRAGRYLRDAIDSVLTQDYPDLEVCVADDGSPDNTLEVLQSYGDEPRLRYVTGPNGGIGHASNRAVRLTRGMYVGQLDSDDRLLPGAVRKLAEYLDGHPDVGCVYGSCERIDATGGFIKKEYSWPVFSREKMLLTSIAHHFRMFRRQAWDRTEGFREDIVNAVDYDMFLKLSEVTQFHHIDEVLYQRRWHGENTSNVNEAFQTTNTYVVQRLSLERQGLGQHWDVHVPDPEKPRDVTYRRKPGTHRVYFWPDYSHSNPYQRLLYAPVADRFECIGADIDQVLKHLKQERPASDDGEVIFHLHWLNKLFAGIETTGNAAAAAMAFLDKLKLFKFCGGRIVWTIHNTVSHDLPFTRTERMLALGVMELADAIHVHSAASLAEIEAHFPVPRDKLHVARHGAYLGAYPDFVSRDDARAELGLDPQDEVLLFFGQIRAYKGVDQLLQAFRVLRRERPNLRLVLAGGRPAQGFFDRAGLDEEDMARVSLFNRFIDDSELQLFFRAADYAVFPYTRILTSGSLLLSLSFGVPTVIPDVGMTREVLGDGRAGELYPGDGGTAALLDALRRLMARSDAGEGPALRTAARETAAAQDWQDIEDILLGRSE